MSSPPDNPRVNFGRSGAMGTRSIGRLLVSFSLPGMVAMAVNATYNIVDTAFVGRLGHEAIAALTVVWPLQLVMIALSVGVGVGANSLISRRLGADRHLEANHAGAQALLLAVLSGLVMMAVVLPLTDPILKLLGARGDVLPLARAYARTVVWFAPLVFLPMAANNLIRAEGNPAFSMVIMVVSALVNIALDPVLIFGLGPAPALGVRGAAIATVLAQAVAAVGYAGYFLSRHSGYHFRPRDFWPAPRVWAGIYSVGAPSMVIQLSGSVTFALANNIAAGFGSLALAAFGVMFRLFQFGFMPCIGINQGVLPLVGYNYGAGNLVRVRSIVRTGALAAAAVTGFFSLLFVLFPAPFVALFQPSPGFVAVAAPGLRVAALMFGPVGASVVFAGFFQGIGRALPAMFLSLARQVLFFLPGLLILPRLFGLTGLWTALPVADGLSFVASLALTAWTFRLLGVPLLARNREP